MNKFSDLGISTLLIKALSAMDINIPTEIQEKAIPVLNKNQGDFIGIAQTGTGKTAAYGLPLLNLIDAAEAITQAVVLVPTRELCQQVADQLQQFAQFMPAIRIGCVVGGAPIKPQIKALKVGAHIIVATPGRLADLIQQEATDLSEVTYMVLDEADELLNLGFKDALDDIIKQVAKVHATWLFSATMPAAVKQLVAKYMRKPINEVSVGTGNTTGVPIVHQYVLLDPIEKFEVLSHFLSSHEGEQGIIFCRTKAAVQKLHKQLAINRFSSGAIHGDLPQGLRDRVMDQFRAGQIKLLVASDVAARGIDIQNLAYVVHYHLPDVPEVYTHRSGRTARAGKTGISLSFVFNEDLGLLHEIEHELDLKIERIPKPQASSLDSNHAYVWAKRVLKIQLDKNPDAELRAKIGQVFEHLSKDELIDRLVAEQLSSKKLPVDPRSLLKASKKI